MVHVDIRSIILALERDDAKIHAQLVRQQNKSEVVDWMSEALRMVKNKVNRQPATTVLVGIAVGAVAYYLFT